MSNKSATPENFIEIAPLSAGSQKTNLDGASALKVAAAIGSLLLGAAGIPAAIGHASGALKLLSKGTDKRAKISAQGFSLYLIGLTASIHQTINEVVPELGGKVADSNEIAAIVVGALNKEPLFLSKRFFQKPGLNPGFIRVRENLLSLLNKLDENLISPKQIDRIGNILGRRFSTQLFSITRAEDAENAFGDFLSYFYATAEVNPAQRGWLWDDYRDYIAQLTYKRLFLHELQGHPSVTLPDLYIPSRAVYIEKPEDQCDSINVAGSSHHKFHALDLERHLLKDWLGLDALKSGHSRLLTGDPGAGKSTFSLIFANKLLRDGWRVLFIPANSIRSLELSLPVIIKAHLTMALRLDAQPNLDQELQDPEGTGKPLVIIIDGLDEYDVGGVTVANAAARLVEHALAVVSDWTQHGFDVRLLLCGRPEAATGLTAHFRDKFHHLHVTGFLVNLKDGEEPANEASSQLLSVDQREEWWSKWQSHCGDEVIGLPIAIRTSTEHGVREITAQPLLNYMLAVLGLYGPEELSNLSALYGALFDRYFERQSAGKSTSFNKICPTIDRFRRIMSEIGLAAWHAGDRSVGTEDLRQRFDHPPLKSWFDQAGKNTGLSAILTAFYTRPEDAANPDSGLAHRYVFTHKSFREYLTAVGLVRFLKRLASQLDSDAEDGWSDQVALAEWLALFGPTAIDTRQWEFLRSELKSRMANDHELSRLQYAAQKLFELALRRKMPIPTDCENIGRVLSATGNAEEALVLALSAITDVRLQETEGSLIPGDARLEISWPAPSAGSEEDYAPTALIEFIGRIRGRPGSPDEMLMLHIGCLFGSRSQQLEDQLATVFRTRPDGYDYARAIDLSGAKLIGANFAGINFRYSRFHRAELIGADLRGTTLEGADLSYANLQDTKLNEAQMSTAMLINTSLDDAQLRTIELAFDKPPTNPNYYGTPPKDTLEFLRTKGAIVDTNVA